ncbi:MAG: tyrosine-type recombinase/integrase, partial [Planctomycetaceae bacterium]
MGSLRKKKYRKPLPPNAEIFEQGGNPFVRWKDRNGKTRKAPLEVTQDGRQQIVLKSSTWYAKFRDGSGLVCEKTTGCRDKTAARSVLTELERRAERVRSKIVTKEEETVSNHAGTPIGQHFESYHQSRIVQELNETRIRNTKSRLNRLAKECGFNRLSDLSADALTRWLGLQKHSGMGAGTRNEYLQELVGFANWCVEDNRLTDNPFTSVHRANTESDQRRKRRALTEKEIEVLLHVTRWRPLAEYGRKVIHPKSKDGSNRANWTKEPLQFEDLATAVAQARERLSQNQEFVDTLEQRGQERFLIYVTLILTGLRRGELASLTIGSLEFDGPTPYASLAPGDEKNGKGTDIVLETNLAAELQKWVDEKRKRFSGTNSEFMSEPLFAVPASLLRVLNRDLKVAGIPKKDERGRTVDIHGMRMTLATMLNLAGVPPRTAQEIMRHSDIRLTMKNYTDEKLLNVAGALDALPKLTDEMPAVGLHASLQASGTEVSRATALPPVFPPANVQTGQMESSVVILPGEFRPRLLDRNAPRTSPKPTKKALSALKTDRAAGVETKGLEPSTSALRTQR